MDERIARLRAHRQNIDRLLKTKLTDLESKFLERRLSEERFWMATLTKESDLPAALK